MPDKLNPTDFLDPKDFQGASTSDVLDPKDFAASSDYPGLLRMLAGAVPRLAGNILGAEGGPTGAGINALGEAGGEALEGSLIPKGPVVEPQLNESPLHAGLRSFLSDVRAPLGRMGVAAGVGSVPAASIVRGGRLAGALKGAALAGTGTAATEAVQGQKLDPYEIGATAGLGGLTGALFGKGGPPAAPSPTPRPAGWNDLTSQAAQDIEERYPIPMGTKTAINPKVQSALEQTFGRPETSGEVVSPVKTPSIEKQQSILDDLSSPSNTGQTKASLKDAIDAAKARRIINARAGAQPGVPALRETISATNPETQGTMSMSTKFVAPEEPAIPATPKADVLAAKASAAATVDPTAPPVQVPPEAARSPEPATTGETPLGKVLRPSRSKKTIVGFQGQVDKILGNVPEAGIETAPSSPMPQINDKNPAIEPEIVTKANSPLNPANRGPIGPQEAGPVTPESIAAAKAASEAQAAEIGREPAWAGETFDHLDPAEFSLHEPLGLGPAPEPQPSPLAQLVNPGLKNPGNIIRTRAGASGLGYAAQKADPNVPQVALDAGRDALKRENAAGAARRAAEASGPPSMSPDDIKAVQDQIDAAKADPSLLKRFMNGESGAVDPRLMKFATGGLGALIGAPIGYAQDPNDPMAAVKGATMGGAVGYAGGSGMEQALERGSGGLGGAVRELTHWRNAGLLSSPSAQLKKLLSDIGTYHINAVEKLPSGDFERGVNMLKESPLLHPIQSIKDYAAGLANPGLASEIAGTQANEGPLGLVARPYSAAQNVIQEAAARAGVSKDEIRNMAFLGKPQSAGGKLIMKAQQDPGAFGAFMRAIHPFARIGVNLGEAGIQRLPGVGYSKALNWEPEATRLARTIGGTAAVGAGAVEGMYNTTQKEQGAEPMSPMMEGLSLAATPQYAVPRLLGRALTESGAARRLYNAIPGLGSLVAAPGPNETIDETAVKAIKNWLDQTAPYTDWLQGTGSIR